LEEIMIRKIWVKSVEYIVIALTFVAAVAIYIALWAVGADKMDEFQEENNEGIYCREV